MLSQYPEMLFFYLSELRKSQKMPHRRGSEHKRIFFGEGQLPTNSKSQRQTGLPSYRSPFLVWLTDQLTKWRTNLPTDQRINPLRSSLFGQMHYSFITIAIKRMNSIKVSTYADIRAVEEQYEGSMRAIGYKLCYKAPFIITTILPLSDSPNMCKKLIRH